MTRLFSLALVLLWTTLAHANPEITVDLPGGATMEFVWIEPGTFVMGDAELGEIPHQVTLTGGYWLGKYEVTEGQWQSVMGDRSVEASMAGTVVHPAMSISWLDAQSFVQQLNTSVADSLYRLPTEAEWEYACRAGTTARWSFGDDEGQLTDYAWYMPNVWSVGLIGTQPVGTKLANGWGLHDMHGNVWEWVQDAYDGSTIDPRLWLLDWLGPVDPIPIVVSDEPHRVIRGGCWSSGSSMTRSAYRAHTPEGWYGVIGTRLVTMCLRPTAVTPRTWGQVKTGD